MPLYPKSPTLLPFELRQDQQEALLLSENQPPSNSSGLRFEFVDWLFFFFFFTNKVILV